MKGKRQKRGGEYGATSVINTAAACWPHRDMDLWSLLPCRVHPQSRRKNAPLGSHAKRCPKWAITISIRGVQPDRAPTYHLPISHAIITAITIILKETSRYNKRGRSFYADLWADWWANNLWTHKEFPPLSVGAIFKLQYPLSTAGLGKEIFFADFWCKKDEQEIVHKFVRKWRGIHAKEEKKVPEWGVHWNRFIVMYI